MTIGKAQSAKYAANTLTENGEISANFTDGKYRHSMPPSMLPAKTYTPKSKIYESVS